MTSTTEMSGQYDDPETKSKQSIKYIVDSDVLSYGNSFRILLVSGIIFLPLLYLNTKPNYDFSEVFGSKELPDGGYDFLKDANKMFGPSSALGVNYLLNFFSALHSLQGYLKRNMYRKLRNRQKIKRNSLVTFSKTVVVLFLALLTGYMTYGVMTQADPKKNSFLMVIINTLFSTFMNDIGVRAFGRGLVQVWDTVSQYSFASATGENQQLLSGSSSTLTRKEWSKQRKQRIANLKNKRIQMDDNVNDSIMENLKDIIAIDETSSLANEQKEGKAFTKNCSGVIGGAYKWVFRPLYQAQLTASNSLIIYLFLNLARKSLGKVFKRNPNDVGMYAAAGAGVSFFFFYIVYFSQVKNAEALLDYVGNVPGKIKSIPGYVGNTYKEDNGGWKLLGNFAKSSSEASFFLLWLAAVYFSASSILGVAATMMDDPILSYLGKNWVVPMCINATLHTNVTGGINLYKDAKKAASYFFDKNEVRKESIKYAEQLHAYLDDTKEIKPPLLAASA